MSIQKTSNHVLKYTRKELIEIGLDNTQDRDDYQNLGILRFLKLLFPERFYNDFGELHYDMAQIFLDLFNPKRERRIDKQAYFLVHREAAKSTLSSFGFVMWCLLLNGHTAYIKRKNEETGKMEVVPFKISEKFIMICSETSSSAEDFVSSIKDTLDSRKDLSNYFGEKSPQYVVDNEERSKDKKWTKTIFKTADGIYVRGLGAGQQTRGRNLGGNRPTLCIVDDMYSENNVKTQQRREALDRWFNSALLNSLDSFKGKCLWLGTLVHPDIVVTNMMKSDDWYGINKPIISPDELNKLISLCKVGNNFEINKELLAEKQKEFKTLSWSGRHNLSYIAHIYKTNAINKDNADYFWQEFMNQAIAPESVSIRPDTFKPVKMEFYNDKGYTCVIFEENGIEWHGVCSLTVGVDMAATIKDSSDKSVIMCAGYARIYPKVPGQALVSNLQGFKNGKVIPIIAECHHGKMDAFQYMDRQGVFDICLALHKKYHLDQIIIEANGQQEMTVRQIRQKFQELGYHNIIKSEWVNTDKKERINAVLKPIIQTMKHFYCNLGDYIQPLYHQTLLLGIGDHDDFPDALEECFKYKKATDTPTIYPKVFEDYQDNVEYPNDDDELDWYYV